MPFALEKNDRAGSGQLVCGACAGDSAPDDDNVRGARSHGTHTGRLPANTVQEPFKLGFSALGVWGHGDTSIDRGTNKTYHGAAPSSRGTPHSDTPPLRIDAPDSLYDLAITGGTVVLPEGPVRVNIAVRGERIAWIGTGALRANQAIDATGRLVLPGGVDSHCHMDQQPWEGRSTADDFRSGTLSALCGGNTTVLPFAMQMRGQSLRAIVDDYLNAPPPRRISTTAFT